MTSLSLVLLCSCAISSAATRSDGAGGGTTTAAPALPKAVDADDRMVQDCQFLGNVVGITDKIITEGVGLGTGANMIDGFRLARLNARKEADLLGATHVVWLADASFMSIPSSQARAYRCAK